jgi:aminoglycoside N3'-acetyltransferase
VSVEAFHALLDSLDVPRGGVLYVQSSTDWLARAGFSAADVLGGLRQWVGDRGTLVMPSYPCRTTHAEYFAQRPTYDVRKTPTAVGLIAEVFRRGPRVHRSLDPDFAIAAEGADAESIAATAIDPDPFGTTSTYARMIAQGASLVGLGVSLNTNSFIHVIDSRFARSYPRSPYLGESPATVIDHSGQAREVRRRVLAPEFQQSTKPSAVAAEIGERPDIVTTRAIGTTNFFHWRLPAWSAWCDAHVRSALDGGQWPCWLRQLGGASQ